MAFGDFFFIIIFFVLAVNERRSRFPFQPYLVVAPLTVDANLLVTKHDKW